MKVEGGKLLKFCTKSLRDLVQNLQDVGVTLVVISGTITKANMYKIWISVYHGRRAIDYLTLTLQFLASDYQQVSAP